MKRLTRYFIEGLLFMMPIAASIYIVYFVFNKIDGLYKFQWPGLGILATLVLITSVGFLVKTLLTKKLLSFVDRMFRHLPLVKMIYTSVKDLIGAFVGDKAGFNKPVFVTLMPGSEVKLVGFMTAESLGKFGLEDSVAVHLPQTFNYAGNLVIVPRAHVTPIDVESGDVMAFIVSGGISIKK